MSDFALNSYCLTVLSRRNIQFLPHPRPTTRRSYKPPVTTSTSTMEHQWDSTHPSPHITSYHTQRLTYTADSFYLDTAQNKTDNSNRHPTYLSRQIMAPYASYNSPFTGSSGHHQELGTNSSRASTSTVVGTLPSSGPEDATGLREPGPDPAPASVFSKKRRLDLFQEDVGVNVDPRTVRVPCGWHGCQVAIYPHRMDIKYHLVEAHKVLPGGDPITCAHPTCGKEIKADSMWQHWITHLGVRIQCTVCRATIAPRADSFKRHFLGSCRGDGRFIVSDNVETCKDVESAMREYSRSKKLRIN